MAEFTHVRPVDRHIVPERAGGILISREYDEMRVESLKTIGATLTALEKA